MRWLALIPLLAACTPSQDEPTKVTATEGGGFSEVLCLGWCRFLDTNIVGETTLVRTPARAPALK